jgi:hypothetical protein
MRPVFKLEKAERFFYYSLLSQKFVKTKTNPF